MLSLLSNVDQVQLIKKIKKIKLHAIGCNYKRYQTITTAYKIKQTVMQKVYLLLRSNKKTGLYTKDELLELKLKPLDLIWVEGKSFGWSYPSEIESLKAFVEAPPANEQIYNTDQISHDKKTINASSSTALKKKFLSACLLMLPKILKRI